MSKSRCYDKERIRQHPPVTRRLLIAEHAFLAQPHAALQVAFGWLNDVSAGELCNAAQPRVNRLHGAHHRDLALNQQVNLGRRRNNKGIDDPLTRFMGLPSRWLLADAKCRAPKPVI